MNESVSLKTERSAIFAIEAGRTNDASGRGRECDWDDPHPTTAQNLTTLDTEGGRHLVWVGRALLSPSGQQGFLACHDTPEVKTTCFKMG